MRRYNVSFFKDLLSSDGHLFKCAQGVFAVDADTPAEAMDAAKEEFTHRIGDWRIYSDAIEIADGMTQRSALKPHCATRPTSHSAERNAKPTEGHADELEAGRQIEVSLRPVVPRGLTAE